MWRTFFCCFVLAFGRSTSGRLPWQEASLRAERFGLRRDVGTYLGASELWAAGWGKTTADEVGIRAIGRLVVCGFCDKALKGRHIQAQGVNPGYSC